MKVNILLYVKLSNSFKKEEKGYETKKLLSVLLAGAMVVSGGSISGLEGIIPEVVAAASSTEWNGQPGVFQVNREAARSTFYSFDTAEKAKAKDRTKSSFYQLLNGDDWKFS